MLLTAAPTLAQLQRREDLSAWRQRVPRMQSPWYTVGGRYIGQG